MKRVRAAKHMFWLVVHHEEQMSPSVILVPFVIREDVRNRAHKVFSP